ncbi:MAG: Gfo/Idh/MocA family oxidoreductase, partial [Candidatus Omnitrophica bacterium]|nr:Gfo/Idh/MocA family oxidoreductase [Candidatus Omnitrophota bacterium]
AVNQNGRWAPHFSYLRQAIRSGMLGEIVSVDFSLQWDHDWVADTVFNEVRHLLLYDFAIHWFDMTCCFLHGKEPQRVFASIRKSPSQKSKQPLLGHALMDFAGGQATLSLDGNTPLGQQDQTIVVGTKGTARAVGESLSKQDVKVHTEKGWFSPDLKGAWFENGFEGTMGELLLAIEEGRTPTHNAEENLDSLALCFAAVASSVEGWAKTVGEVTRLVD